MVLFRDVALPRTCLALLCGAALGASGAIFQQVLRNPLAEPTTMGVSAGGYLAMTLAVLLAPAWPAPLPALAVTGGGMAALLAVLGLGARSRFSPAVLTVGGITVSLLCGAINSYLILSHGNLRNLPLWGSGSLDRQGWPDVRALVWQLPLLLAGCLPMLRPLTLLELDAAGARSLGLSLLAVRPLALTLALLLAVIVVTRAGIISFVGLAAPIIANLAGARRFPARLAWAVLVGAALLWLTDAGLQALSPWLGDIPAGSATTILGAPVLLWLLPRTGGRVLTTDEVAGAGPYRRSVWRQILMLLALCLAVGFFSLHAGLGLHGWRWSDAAETSVLAAWRAPRLLAAGAAGAMLGLAGSLMQILTRNPMASPEVLGVSSGAAMGVIVLAFIHPAFTLPMLLAAATLGAMVVLAQLLIGGMRRGFAPERMLLAGITLALALGGVEAAALTSGNPRLMGLLAWLSGSTYLVQWPEAKLALVLAGLLGALTGLLSRWLDLLSLGPTMAQAAGLNLARGRGGLVVLAALLTAAANVIVGPLSFVGLMAPHMARMLGFRRPIPQLYGAAILGALIMLLADWLGRNLMFPDQVPAGLLATFIGAPYFLWLMWRRRA